MLIQYSVVISFQENRFEAWNNKNMCIQRNIDKKRYDEILLWRLIYFEKQNKMMTHNSLMLNKNIKRFRCLHTWGNMYKGIENISGKWNTWNVGLSGVFGLEQSLIHLRKHTCLIRSNFVIGNGSYIKN